MYNSLTPIYLDPAMVPAHIKGAYNGRKFKAYVCTETTIPADAGLWSGGTSEKYAYLELSTGKIVPFPGQISAPWNKGRQEYKVTLEPGFAVVKHSYFCGKDTGLTFFVHPDNAAALLPAPVAELTDMEKLVLDATCSFKSSYNGRNRYELTTEGWNGRARTMGRPKPTLDDWNYAKASLIGKGLLNKAGAVTPAGRNARVRVL